MLGQLFGVVKQLVTKILRQDDSSGIDSSSQATATGFIATTLRQIGIQIGSNMVL